MRRLGRCVASGTVDLRDERWPQCTYVYRIYDHTDRLLYVGMTDHLRKRLRDHKSKPWGGAAFRVEWDLWDDREAAGREEWRLIRRHRPPWNVEMNSDDFYEPEPVRRTACGL